MNNTERVELITTRIKQALSPTVLQVIDDSDQHIGHAGAQSGAGHFTIIIASPYFSDLSRVACHRLINQTLEDLFTSEIHALSIKIVHNNPHP
jgi:BolA family transcriptional regulator, general stress-responsive regulator